MPPLSVLVHHDLSLQFHFFYQQKNYDISLVEILYSFARILTRQLTHFAFKLIFTHTSSFSSLDQKLRRPQYQQQAN